MPLKQYRPTSPGRRGMTGSSFEEITKSKPEKSLLAPLKRKAGRSNQGRITVRHRGGGAKRRLRILDFKRDKEGKYALVRLPSGEVRRISIDCLATIGQVGNVDHRSVNLGKAGRKRWMGWRPTVRGSAMNPRDHPHGGGEGKAPIGLPGPKTPWGKPALGYRTRKAKASDRMIVKRRGK